MTREEIEQAVYEESHDLDFQFKPWSNSQVVNTIIKIHGLILNALRDERARANKWEAIANLPEPSHVGSCTPETNCDGICMDRANVFNMTWEQWQAQAHRELMGESDGLR